MNQTALRPPGKACFFEALVWLTSACLLTIVRAEDRARKISVRSIAPFTRFRRRWTWFGLLELFDQTRVLHTTAVALKRTNHVAQESYSHY